MYIVKAGSVKIIRKVKGQENTIAALNAGEFFGEMALLDGLPRSAAVRTIEDTEVFMIPAEGYQALRRDKPHTALKVMDIIIKVLSNRLRQANKNLEVISFWID
jgi:CRP-like cAMP-binding protein